MTNELKQTTRKMTAADYAEMKKGGLTIEGTFQEVAPGRTPPADHSGAYIYKPKYGGGVSIHSLDEPETQFDIRI